MIEVGIDVPNSVIMVIENAERFGLSQLHQLRGRIGRGSHRSTCILISDAKDEKTQKRLSILTSTSDGFKIADEDLKLRGPGDFFGSRQHGLPELKIADMMTDTEAIRVFANNLRQLLLDSPIGQKRVLALDPGFRTGCKLVVLTPQGDLVMHSVVYVHNVESPTILANLIQKYRIEAIAIGNGTASRETEQMTQLAIKQLPQEMRPQVFVVSENGASVYSASKLAREEFPNEDVTVRGAVSIVARVQKQVCQFVEAFLLVGRYIHSDKPLFLRTANG